MSQGDDSGRLPNEASRRAPPGWLNRPSAWLTAPVLGLVIVATPYWLLSDHLKGFALQPTDFVYIEDARDAATLWQHLMDPLNTHVVPLFRIWTYALVCAAGRLEELPRVLWAASYLALVVTMALAGLLVLRETGRVALALSAMVCLGVSTVVLPVLNHFAASQALWAAAAVVATLLAARGWRATGGGWRFGLVALGVVASTAVWSGGLTAGPAVAAALWADGRPRCRRAALAVSAVTCAAAVGVVWLSRGYIQQTPMVWERHRELWPRPVQGVLHTAQGIVEGVVLNNLGLDAETAPFQAVVIVAGLAGLWYATRGRVSRVTPLEAAGVAFVAASGLMTYLFRGNLPFRSIRGLGWYYAMPQVGAALLAVGWWAGVAKDVPRDGGRLTWGEALAVVALLAALLGVQAVRAERLLIEAAPPLAPSELPEFPVPSMQRPRAIYLNGEFAERQRRMLARLDRAERVARPLGIGKAAIRRTFGRLPMTGMSDVTGTYDAAGMLSLPDGDPGLSPALVRSALADYYRAEDAPRPPWLAPSDPWPTRTRSGGFYDRSPGGHEVIPPGRRGRGASRTASPRRTVGTSPRYPGDPLLFNFFSPSAISAVKS